jgi:hypothetical protein
MRLVLTARVSTDRAARATELYRLVEVHHGRFEQVYPARYEERCGFVRVRCRYFGHEYLLYYSCKRRYFCTTCHTKRAVAFAERLHTAVLWPVAHRQIVLTIPKMLRASFRYDRRLLGDLCRVAADVLVNSFRVLFATPQAEPGLVVCVHSFGNLLNFHPHLHIMATDGGFTKAGAFHPLAGG